MDSTTALSYGVALARRRSSDVEHVEQPVDLRVVEPAALVRVEHLHLGQGEVECGERGHDQVGGAARVGAVCVCSIEVRPMQRNYSVRKSGRN